MRRQLCPPNSLQVETVGGVTPVSVSRQRQPGVDPVFLAFHVLADVDVPHGRQLTGGLPGRGSREVPAVHDDLGTLVRDERGDARGDLVGREALGAGQVVLAPVHEGQHLEEVELVAAVDLFFQLGPGYGGHAQGLGG